MIHAYFESKDLQYFKNSVFFGVLYSMIYVTIKYDNCKNYVFSDEIVETVKQNFL